MFAQDFIENIAKEIVKAVTKLMKKQNIKQTLSRQEVIETLGTSSATFNEIKKRDDFKFVMIEGLPNRFSGENLNRWINGERMIKR